MIKAKRWNHPKRMYEKGKYANGSGLDISIGGMTLENYDSDRDIEISGGKIGHALANLMIMSGRRHLEKVLADSADFDGVENEFAGVNSRRAKTDVNKVDIDYWAKIAGIALVRFPELEKGERICSHEIRKRLREIKSAGYPVESSDEFSPQEAWNYLQKIKVNIILNAEIYCPDVLRQINERNAKQRNDARTYR